MSEMYNLLTNPFNNFVQNLNADKDGQLKNI
jgi:hypothetical protein